MGEFNEAVSTLLEAFTSGLAIIRSVRERRKDAKTKVTPEVRAEESKLRKSLKKSRIDVSVAYSRDLSKLGTKFAAGDVKARSSLTSILFRLNAGFVTIIDRFTRGKSTKADYQNLVSLSNASRKEAINTFTQLSSRLSQSSLSVKSASSRKSGQKKTKGSLKSKSSVSQARKIKSAPDLSLSKPLGSSGKSKSSRPKAKTIDSGIAVKSTKSDAPILKVSSNTDINPGSEEHTPWEIYEGGEPMKFTAYQMPRHRPGNRMSIMTFASGSTKLGEIPEKRWLSRTEETDDPSAGTAFPLTSWQEPSKPRSRFMRIFHR